MFESLKSTVGSMASGLGSWISGRKLAWTAAKQAAIPTGATAVAVATADEVSFARVAVCLLAVLLLPLVLFAPMRGLVARRSNLINAVLLGGYSLADVALALCAVEWVVSGWLSGLVFVAMSAGGFFYSLAMMTFAHRLETK